MRNSIISKCKDLEGDHSRVANIYFGLENEHGSTDKSYPHAIDGLYQLTDDCIFFSKALCEELSKHGKFLSKSYGKGSPDIPEIQLVKAKTLELLPNEENYKDFISDEFFAKRNSD